MTTVRPEPDGDEAAPFVFWPGDSPAQFIANAETATDRTCKGVKMSVRPLDVNGGCSRAGASTRPTDAEHGLISVAIDNLASLIQERTHLPSRLGRRTARVFDSQQVLTQS